MKVFITMLCICIYIFFAFTPNKTSVTNKEDYNHFLAQNGHSQILDQEKEYNFWSAKFDAHPNQYPYLIKMAHAKNALFQYEGKIEHLTQSTKLLETANKMINSTDAAILRMLAKNYISEHRFNESLEQLLDAQQLGVGLLQTEKMLFDVYMELGDYANAEYYLKNPLYSKNSFDYLIRMSKWADHKGNLKEAIYYLNNALKAAEMSKNKKLVQWALTNLADYYGHDGNIQKSYEYFLKALALDPSDAYAKKGIAWILYSHERNTNEALRILDFIERYHYSPHTLLLKAEIAEYANETSVQEEILHYYFQKISSNKAYRKMYSSYNIMLLTENFETLTKALSMAQLEVEKRPTPQSYGLLAWVNYKMGNYEEAKELFAEHVEDKTHEPEPLFLMAQVLSQEQSTTELKALKIELTESIYELGPLAEKEIIKL